MKTILLSGVLSLTLALHGCKSDKKTDSSGKQESADKSGGGGLEMANKGPACTKAMKCCEAYAKLGTGSVTPEDLNLKCSGVAMAKTDAECDQFRQGYVPSFEGKGVEVPADCK